MKWTRRYVIWINRLIGRFGRAVLEGRTVGELISEAIRGYLGRGAVKRGSASLRALRPEPFPEGNEQVSCEIDDIVYGGRR